MKRHVGPRFTAVWSHAFAVVAVIIMVSSAHGAIESFHPAINGLVRTVAVQPDGKILIGGNFSSVNGAPRSYLARLNRDGSSDTTFSPANAPAAFVNHIQVSGSKIYVGAGDGVRCFDLNGALDWHYPMAVETFTVDSQQRLILGGQFIRIENQPHRNIARLSAAGTLDTSFSTAIGCCAGEGVFALATIGDSILVGGKFQSVNTSYVVSHLVKLHADGSFDATFNAAADPLVLAIVPTADGKAFRLSESTLARHLATGEIDPAFAPVSVDGSSVERFLAMAVQGDGKVVVGGSPVFAARYNPDGTLDNSFTAQTDGAVQAIVIEASGDVLLAGSFTRVNGEQHDGLARVSSASGTMAVPALSMSRGASDAVILCWPQTPTTYSLQACDLGGSTWTTVDGAPVLADGQNWFTNSAAGAGKFFRLTSQP